MNQTGKIMKISSVNRAVRQTIEFNGERFETGIFKTAVDESVQVTRFGIAGDAIVDTSVHGGADQAIYLYGAEDYAWWARVINKNLAPGTFGENLTTNGLELRDLIIGDRLRIGHVLLEISAPRTPCFKLATRMGDPKFAKKFVHAARPGAYARVLQEGALSVGDDIRLEKTTGDCAGVVEIFNAWHAAHRERALLEKALRSPIGEHHRKRIQALYDACAD